MRRAGEVVGPTLAGLLIGWFGVPVILGVRAALAVATELQAWRIFRGGQPLPGSAPAPTGLSED